MFDWINIIAFAIVLILAILVHRLMKPEYALYTWVSIAFILLRGTPSFVFNGVLRYALDIFPLFIAPAILLSRPNRWNDVAVKVILFMGFSFQIILVLFFASWIWVS